MLVVLLALSLTGAVLYRGLYGQAVNTCSNGESTNEPTWTDTEQGWQSWPLGFWCKRTYRDGYIEHINLGILP
ncbi:hypothetical protein JOD67_003233 [Tenggerimyces flavus]|nr:hypothetical protein [Tenggerimyces flavus]